MIDFHDILAPDSARIDQHVQSKKAALKIASDLIAARSRIGARSLLQGLLTRERLGSTGLGEGVAIPHCRSTDCDEPTASLIRTTHPIDFNAPDDQAVDLLFVLAVPTHEQRAHLEILGALARAFDDPGNLAALRAATTDRELFATLQGQLDMVQRE